jgi:hypothetical protein
MSLFVGILQATPENRRAVDPREDPRPGSSKGLHPLESATIYRAADCSRRFRSLAQPATP